MRQRIFVLAILFASISFLLPNQTQGGDGVPVFKVTPVESTVKFDVEASVAIIPFIKIADRVEVTVKLKATRVSGPPVALKQ